jgi:hypothetical protein
VRAPAEGRVVLQLPSCHQFVVAPKNLQRCFALDVCVRELSGATDVRAPYRRKITLVVDFHADGLRHATPADVASVVALRG